MTRYTYRVTSNRGTSAYCATLDEAHRVLDAILAETRDTWVAILREGSGPAAVDRLVYYVER